MHSGFYGWGDGVLYYQESTGAAWWSTRAYSDAKSYGLYLSVYNLGPQDDFTKKYGFTLRCISLIKPSSF